MYIFLFILFSLGSLARISFANQEINIYLYELVYFGYLGWLFYKYRLKPFHQFHNIWLDAFLVSLVVGFILHAFDFSLYQNLVGLMYLGRIALYFLGIPYLLYDNMKTKNPQLSRGFLIYVILTAIVSNLVYILYPNLRNLSYLGWDPHASRMMGLMFDVSFAAALYGLTLITLLYGPRLVKNETVRVGLIVAYTLMGVFTFARGFYIAILATVVYQLFVKSKRAVYALYLILAVVAVLVFIPKPFGEGGNLLRTSTIGSRMENYAEGLIIWRRNPLFGVGYNRLRYVAPAKQSISDPQTANHAGASFHSSYLTILATAGIVGLALFLLYLYSLGSISQVARLYVLFLGIYSLFDNTLLHPTVLFLLSLLLVYTSLGKKVTFRISR